MTARTKFFNRRSTRAGVLLGLVLSGTATAAFATTGYQAQQFQVKFFWGETAGHGDSNDFSGYGPAALCANATGYMSNNTYGVQYVHNRTGLPDQVLTDQNLSYNGVQMKYTGISTDTNAMYHTNVNWSAVPAAPDTVSGFSRAVATMCSDS